MRKTFLFSCSFALMVGGFAGCTAFAGGCTASDETGGSGRLNSGDGRSSTRVGGLAIQARHSDAPGGLFASQILEVSDVGCFLAYVLCKTWEGSLGSVGLGVSVAGMLSKSTGDQFRNASTGSRWAARNAG